MNKRIYIQISPNLNYYFYLSFMTQASQSDAKSLAKYSESKSQRLQKQKLRLAFGTEKKQVDKLMKNGVNKSAKQAFDRYVDAKDLYIRYSFAKDLHFLSNLTEQVDPQIFKPLSQVKISDLVQYKQSMVHIDQQEVLSFLDWKNPSLKQVYNIILPSVLHQQLDLFIEKFYFYKRIGLEKQLQDSAKLLINSSKFTSNHFKSPQTWLDKANKAKKQGHNKKAIEILTEGITKNKEAQTGVEKSQLYRKLALLLMETDKDGGQVLANFDKAIKLQKLNKVQICRQRMDALQKIYKNPPAQNHKTLIKYFEDSIKKSSPANLANCLIEFANFYKSMGDVNNALKTFTSALQAIPKEQQKYKAPMLRNQAYFLVQIGKIPQAIKLMRKAETPNNPSSDYSRFLGKILQLKNLDPSTKDLVKSKMYDPTVHYPYGCDLENYKHQGIKAKKNKNHRESIQLFRKGIQNTEDKEQKSQLYKFIAISSKSIDKDGYLVMTAYDQAISLTKINRAKLIIDRNQTLWQLSSTGSVDEHKGLLKYFQNLTKSANPKRLADIYLEKANSLKRLGDKSQALKTLIQAISSLDSSDFFRKSQLLKQQAYWLNQMGKKQQALKTFQKALTTYESKNNDKIRFLWQLGMFSQAQKQAQTSQDPYKLRSIAYLHCKDGDKLRQTTKDLSLIRQKFLKAVSCYDKAIKLLSDYFKVKSFLQEQALAFRKAFNFSENEYYVIEQHQDKLLSQMGIIQDFKFLWRVIDKSIYRQVRNNDTELYRLYSNSIARQPFSDQSFKEIRTQLLSLDELLQRKIQGELSIQQLLSVYPENIILPHFIQTIITNLSQKLWQSGRYIEAYKVFQKTFAINEQNLHISLNQRQSVMRKTYSAQKLFKEKRFEECLTTLKSISSFPSEESAVYVPSCGDVLNTDKSNDLNTFLRQSQILCHWNLGNYPAACNLFQDLISFTSKQLEDFLQQEYDNAPLFLIIMKYNTILHMIKDKKYQDSIKKIKTFEAIMNQKSLPIIDPNFYLQYATACSQAGKQQLASSKSQQSSEIYFEFLTVFQKINQISSLPKNHIIFQFHKISTKKMKEQFSEQLERAQSLANALKSLHFNQNTTTIVYKDIQPYIQKINQRIDNCFKIKEFNIIEDQKKVDLLNSLKQTWDQTCFILFKEVINKDYSQQLLNVKNLIGSLRQQMTQMVKIPEKSIDNALTEAKLEELVKEAKEDLDALKQKSIDNLNQIQSIYDKIRNELNSLGSNNKTPSDDIIRKLSQENISMQKKSKVFYSFIRQFKQQLQSLKAKFLEQAAKKEAQEAKKSPQDREILQKKPHILTNEQKQNLLEKMNELKEQMQKNFVRDINKKIEEINQNYQNLKKKLQNPQPNISNPSNPSDPQTKAKFLDLNHSILKHDDKFKNIKKLLNQTISESDETKRKLEEYKKLVEGLQNLIKNAISLPDIEKMLNEFFEKHKNTISQQSRRLMQKLMGTVDKQDEKERDILPTVLNLIRKSLDQFLDQISALFAPINDHRAQKYYKRVREQLLIQEKQIKNLKSIMKVYEQNQVNSKMSQEVQSQISQLMQQAANTKEKIKTIYDSFRQMQSKFKEKTSLSDLKQLKQQILSSYHQNQDVIKKLSLLSTETLIGNYHDLLQHILMNDRKINILSNKVGTKIVTSFPNILRNDNAKYDKHGRLKFQQQPQEIRLNPEPNIKQLNKTQNLLFSLKNNDPSNDKQGHGRMTPFRHKKSNKKKFSQVDGFKIIDNGRKSIQIEGENSRKLNVVVLQKFEEFEEASQKISRKLNLTKIPQKK